MGEVYKAFDPTLQRMVAVKTIRPDIDRPEYLERMMREAQACARLSHPNIVTIFEAGRVDAVVFIAMEFLQGQNLADALDRRVLSLEEKIYILTKVLDALQHAHAFDVVHRDIKPSNIHLQADGTIKLMDFGLARVLTAETLTASGNVLGTPHYASPEQLKGEAVDRRTDIYSTGVMAYEMLSGRRPFEPDNDTISSVIIKVISEAAKPMDTDLSRLLPEIETIVSKAMAKRPDERYQCADDMRKALVTFLESSRAKLTAMEPSAGSTVLLPSTVGSGQDAIPTFRVDRSPLPPPQFQSQPQLQARPELPSRPELQPASASQSHAPLPPPAAAASRAKWYVGGMAAAALIVTVLVLGRPSAVAENRVAPPPMTTPDAPSGPAGSTGTAASSEVAPTGATTPASAPVSTPPAPAPPPAATRGAAETAAKPPAPAAVPASAPETAVVPRSAGAKEMFTSTSADASPGLRFRMVLEGQDGKAVDVDPARAFHTGERIKFAFESNVDGYLYVAQQGTSGNWTVLFPHPDINGGRNAVKRFEEHDVPNDGWFQLAGAAGEEQLFVFLSREPLKTLPGFDRPVREGYGSAPPTLVAELASSIRSRDLVFAKDASATKGQQATYVVNKAELGKAVTAKFTINHQP